MESKLFVGNLSFSVTQDQLRALFAQAGDVREAAVILDLGTGRSKGFGFVEMKTEADAEQAIKEFHNHVFDGRRMTVNVARPPDARIPPRGNLRGARGVNRNGTRSRY